MDVRLPDKRARRASLMNWLRRACWAGVLLTLLVWARSYFIMDVISCSSDRGGTWGIAISRGQIILCFDPSVSAGGRPPIERGIHYIAATPRARWEAEGAAGLPDYWQWPAGLTTNRPLPPPPVSNQGGLRLDPLDNRWRRLHWHRGGFAYQTAGDINPHTLDSRLLLVPLWSVCLFAALFTLPVIVPRRPGVA